MYDTIEEANQKLSGSVVLFNSSPVFIEEAVGKAKKVSLRYRLLSNSETRTNLIDEKGWEFRNFGPRLGYMNVDFGTGKHRETSYVVRSPVRNTHSCQGLSGKNLRFSVLRGSSKLGLGSAPLGFNSMYASKPFQDMLEQKYPTLSSISDEFSKEPWLISKAFNRQFAVRRGEKDDLVPYTLEYRNKKIGYTEDFYRWKIGPDFKYLTESLEPLNIKVS